MVRFSEIETYSGSELQAGPSASMLLLRYFLNSGHHWIQIRKIKFKTCSTTGKQSEVSLILFLILPVQSIVSMRNTASKLRAGFWPGC
ncbi:hypothetical protein CleRT_09550 [Candidatus Coxiella mudrowiae]|uniref:Uncharacterized protein n=1 Tax=Candidatus Coxiella mudrowiae TaxID=2054173 RepID=A0ABM5UUN0_9COXI|nr:hypothetical protein CleRT_09550 [Candidatus Coxiella mudrowiae]